MKGVLLLTVAIIFNGCSNKESKISVITEGFLDAYFSIDYLAASSFCTKELGEELIETLKGLDTLEPSVRSVLEKQSKEVKTEIISIDTKSSSDTVTVLYKVILPNFPQGIENTLSVVKKDKRWCIAGLGQ